MIPSLQLDRSLPGFSSCLSWALLGGAAPLPNRGLERVGEAREDHSAEAESLPMKGPSPEDPGKSAFSSLSALVVCMPMGSLN